MYWKKFADIFFFRIFVSIFVFQNLKQHQKSGRFCTSGPLIPLFSSEMEEEELGILVVGWCHHHCQDLQCLILSRQDKYGHTRISGHLCKNARILWFWLNFFVIYFLLILCTFRALLSCLANRSIKLWTCTKSKKYDKITKTWISPGFMPGFCPAFCKKIAQIITKMSLDKELVTLDLPCMTSCSPTTGPFGSPPTQPSCLVSLYLSQYDELRVAGGVEGGVGDLP